MSADIAILDGIKKDLETIPKEDDEKFKELEKILVAVKKKHPEQKMLIFSEYADTVYYLYERLKNAFANVDAVTSDAGEEIPKKAAYFAPIANRYDGPKKIDVMIATDVMSEGYNLQDCNMVINYDLHWNPVRLIQRAGRVDRIGSTADRIYIHNFLPADKINKELNLKEILKKRIEEIHAYIGEDGKILDESERLNEEAMYCIYDEKDMEGVEKDEDIGFSFDEAESLIKQIEKDQPEYMALIKKMQLGLRSAKAGKTSKGVYAFFKSGNIAKLYIRTQEGKVIENFSEVINEIRCDRTCPEVAITEPQWDDYYQRLEEMRGMFKASLAHENLRLKPHTEVLKSKKKLQEIVGLFSTDEVRENAERLDKVLNEYFPHHLVPLLKRLNKEKMTEEKYLAELIDIYNKEQLGEIVAKVQKDDTKRPIEFIGGEIMV